MNKQQLWKALKEPTEKTCENCKYPFGMEEDPGKCYDIVGSCHMNLNNSKWEWDQKTK